MKLLNCFLVISSLVVGGSVYAVPNANSCSDWSKNPECWGHSEPEFSATCQDLRFCTRVKVVSSQQGSYICQGAGNFDCSEIVAKYGVQIVGLPVLVTYGQFDTCHKPGACGNRACRPSAIGYATDDPICQ